MHGSVLSDERLLDACDASRAPITHRMSFGNAILEDITFSGMSVHYNYAEF